MGNELTALDVHIAGQEGLAGNEIIGGSYLQRIANTQGLQAKAIQKATADMLSTSSPGYHFPPRGASKPKGGRQYDEFSTTVFFFEWCCIQYAFALIFLHFALGLFGFPHLTEMGGLGILVGQALAGCMFFQYFCNRNIVFNILGSMLALAAIHVCFNSLGKESADFVHAHPIIFLIVPGLAIAGHVRAYRQNRA